MIMTVQLKLQNTAELSTVLQRQIHPEAAKNHTEAWKWALQC